ncbi:MAG: universal stress protein [Dermatophilaceae bacterium]
MSSSVEATGRNGRIVVGVDGATGSLAALRWAVAEARLRHATVEAVIAWAPPQTYGYAPAYPIEDFQADAAAALEQAVDSVREDIAGVEFVSTVTQGRPAPVLLAAGAKADLLVVGSRGHGGFAGMLLGSVSQHCVHHAVGPVVVVPQ